MSHPSKIGGTTDAGSRQLCALVKCAGTRASRLESLPEQNVGRRSRLGLRRLRDGLLLVAPCQGVPDLQEDGVCTSLSSKLAHMRLRRSFCCLRRRPSISITRSS